MSTLGIAGFPLLRAATVALFDGALGAVADAARRSRQ
jgi:hypothetical protein